MTAGSGGVALINKAPHPNAAKVALNWLLSRDGQIAYQRLFAQGNDGPDSMRIDIPKTKCRAETAGPRAMRIATRSSTAPSGWTRRRSASSSKKCWSSGENNFGFAIWDFGLENGMHRAISEFQFQVFVRQSKIQNPKC